jgi:hypothetical protein
MPYKLIKLGNQPPLLFDVTTPDGESDEKNLAAKYPQIVARMEKHLRAWAADLKPAGLLSEDSPLNRHHIGLFAEHKIIPADKETQTPPTKAGIQGWIARNGALEVKKGVLVLTPETNSSNPSRPFLTNANLDLAGPVTATLRLRAQAGGQGKASITWRTKEESFAAHQSASFDWPVGSELQEIQVPLAEKSRILHLRITPPAGATGIEIQSIELKDIQGKMKSFRFDTP